MFSSISRAQETKIQFYQEKISKIENYIKELETKLVEAKVEENAKKMKSINMAIEKQVERINMIKNDIEIERSKIEASAPKPGEKKPEAKKPGFSFPKGFSIPKGSTVNTGFKAGTIPFGLGITPALTPTLPMVGKVETRVNAEYGIGKQYNILLMQFGGTTDTSKGNYTGLTLDIVNYSNRIKNIPGMTYVIEKGLSVGASIFWGRAFGQFAIEAGYSNVLGLVAMGRYRFN